MQSYTIHFVRHGMTEANLTGKYAGVWNIPVCDEGKAKLQKLKNDFEYPKVQEYYSSSLKRCIQTCDIIYPNAEPIIIDGLKECNFGSWEGKTTKELLNNPEYMAWVKADRKTTPPGGENGADFYNRVCSAFEELVESLMRRKVTSSAVFTHGGVIMMILSSYGIPRAQFYDWIVDNGCGYSVRITPGLWMRNKVFEVYQKFPLGASGEVSGEFKELIDNLSGQRK